MKPLVLSSGDEFAVSDEGGLVNLFDFAQYLFDADDLVRIAAYLLRVARKHPTFM